MPVLPAIPVGGLAGLRFLDSTMERQVAVFDSSPDIKRDVEYFEQNAGSITTVEQLMADRRVLGVVLGAFGLDEDIDKRAFIRKVIDEGTLDPDAFANRLVDPAYKNLSLTLGFGDLGGLLTIQTTRAKIVEQYKERQFEQAVGEVDVDMRLALNFRREAVDIAGSGASESTGWLQMLGSPPLREVVTTALGLPTSAGGVDLDQQVEDIARRAESLFGARSVSVLSDPENLDRMVDLFMLRKQQINGGLASTSAASTALSLLQASGLGGNAQANLFQSNLT